MARKPRSVDLTQVSEWDDGAIRRKEDYLAAEEPLEIRIGADPLSVTMRTPGHDLELAAGFLFTEGLVQRRAQILALEALEGDAGTAAENLGNVVLAKLAPESAPDFEKMRRHFFAASSCGICGKASIDSVRARTLQPPNPDFRFDPEVLVRLPETLRASQAVFGRTGGLHAAGLFDAAGELLVLREDIGRHNAVDKVIGWALLEERVPLSETVLLVSGRVGFGAIKPGGSACARTRTDPDWIFARPALRGLCGNGADRKSCVGPRYIMPLRRRPNGAGTNRAS